MLNPYKDDLGDTRLHNRLDDSSYFLDES